MHLLHSAVLLKLVFGSKWVQKTKTSIYEISRTLFSSMDFTLAHFANFNFAHFEIEKKVYANLGKITKWSISLANFHFR